MGGGRVRLSLFFDILRCFCRESLCSWNASEAGDEGEQGVVLGKCVFLL